jgi:hypothetical protein
MLEKYRYLTKSREVIRLTDGTEAEKIAVCARAVQEFLNRRIDTTPKLGQDMAKLQEKLGLGTDQKITIAPQNLTLTLGAMALYRWRTAHPAEDVGKWGERIGVKVEKPAPVTIPLDAFR